MKKAVSWGLTHGDLPKPGDETGRRNSDNYDEGCHMKYSRRSTSRASDASFDVDLKLNALNVVIGANGSGKTSLLDVFSLLAASASGKLKEKMSELERDRCEPDQPAGRERRQGEVHGV